MKIITVMQLPGRSAQVNVPDDATANDCVQAAGFDASGYTLSSQPSVSGLNGSSVLPDGTTLGLTRPVKGA